MKKAISLPFITKSAALSLFFVMILSVVAHAATLTTSNSFLEIRYDDVDSKYTLWTTGGDPDKSSDNYQRLLYGSAPGTSYASIKYNSTNMVYGVTSLSSLSSWKDTSVPMQLVSSPTRSGSGDTSLVTSTYTYNNLNVTQNLRFVDGKVAGRRDVLEAEYVLTNNSLSSINSGVRIMYDTMLGSNDDAPFYVPGVGSLTTHKELTGSAIPNYWQAFDNLTSPTVVAQGTLIRKDGERPNKVQFTNWSSVRGTTWNYSNIEGTANGDSAVVMYYEFALPAGQTKVVRTYYGVSGLNQNLNPPLGISVNSDPSVQNVNGGYTPNPITVQTYLNNLVNYSVSASTLTYELPAGIYILDSGVKRQTFSVSTGSFSAMQQKLFTQPIYVENQSTDKTFNYAVKLNTPGQPLKTLNLSLFVPGIDASAPSVPTNISATNVTRTSAQLSWTASNDNIGVTGYEVYRNGTLVGTTITPSFTMNGLAEGQTYSITVRAYDSAGNKSNASSPFNLTTLSSDTTAPSVPNGLSKGSPTATGYTISWNPSTDNVAVTGYEVYRNGTLVGTTSSTNHTFTGLSVLSSHAITVRAYDAAGNKSVASTALNAVVDDVVAPNAPANLMVSAKTSNSVSLSWSAPADNVAVTGYEIFNGTNPTPVGTASGTSFTVTGLSGGSAYTFTVRARDAAGNRSASSNEVVCTLGNSPSNISLSTSSITENNAANVTFATLTATDPDPLDTFSYSLVNGTGSTDNASFSIQGATLRANVSFNFEVKSSYSIRIRVTDSNNLTFEKTFTITINNVNEAPTDIVLSASTLPENAGINATVGTLSATDPDVGTTFTYSLVSGDGATDNGSFNINGAQLRATNSLNYESASSYSVRIQVVDAGGLTFAKVFTIGVTNVNEAPSSISLSSNLVDENVWVGYVVGTLTATDPDVGDTIKFSLTAGEGDDYNTSFTITGNQLRTVDNFEYVEDAEYFIRVNATDAAGLSYAQPIEIIVTQANVKLDDSFKQLTVYFQEKLWNNTASVETLKNQMLIADNASDEIVNYEPAASLIDNITINNKDNTVLITFKTPLAANIYRMKFAANAFRDIGNNKSAELVTSPFVVDSSGPKIVSVVVDKRQRVITITFNKTIFNTSTAAKSADKLKALKDAITITRNSNADTPVYNLLDARDSVVLAGRKLIVRLTNRLTDSNNKLRIAADALQDVGANKTPELNPNVELDTTGPSISKVTVESKNKKITISFKDLTSNNLTRGSAAVKAAALKAGIQLTVNGLDYAPLDANDQVDLISGQLIITLNTALTGSQNRVKILPNILKDEYGNANAEIVSSVIIADGTGPVVVGAPSIQANSGNRTIEITFDERIFNASTERSPAVRAQALRAAVQYTLDADATTVTWTALSGTSERVMIKGKKLIISLSKSLPASKNFRVKIDAAVLNDLTGNSTLAIETDLFTIDTTGPKLR